MSTGANRAIWGSKIGFVLAASGSAIGLGNIVFFGANAYRYGGGAFYLPYLTALLVLGLPMMIVELAIGQQERRALPGAMRRTCGKTGEFFAWWSLLNATIIAMYYITILAWSASMMFKSFGPLFADGAASVGSTFGGVLTSWMTVVFTIGIWALNVLFLSKGTRTIEAVVKLFVPLMWVFMLMLVVRGLTLDGGFDGLLYLFTPDFEGIKSPGVWQGACSQIFFSLSLGLGTMTAYASYLPKKSDTVTNAGMVSFLNCSFEFIAGVAIFSILFAFSMHPGQDTGTLGMSLVVVPTGIAQFPAMQTLIAFAFFLLMVVAGLTSSISIIESPVAALQDKFGWSRRKTLALVTIFGAAGSVAFALPQMLTINDQPAQPLGISLLELFDHWAFGYSLLVVGMVEAILIGHIYGIKKLREKINAHSRVKLGAWFDFQIKWVVPVLLGIVLLFNIAEECGLTIEALGISGRGFYIGDSKQTFDGLSAMPIVVFLTWFLITLVGALSITAHKGAQK